MELQIDIQIKGLLKKFLVAKTNQNLKQEIISKEKLQVDFTVNQVKTIAGRVADGIHYNIAKGLTYKGNKVAPNKESTIRRKKQAYPLIETGELLRSVRIKKSGKGYIVYIAKGRADIAEYLQKGHKYMKARPFFGITKKKYTEIVESVINKRKGYVPEIVKALRG